MVNKNQNQSLLCISLISLQLISLTLATLSPATSPIQSPPNPPISPPTKPLISKLPPSPNDKNTPENPSTDIAQILKTANSFNIFLRLMKTTQLINQLNSQLITIKSGGLTILAPEDSSFSELKPGFLNTLSNEQKLELLQFHVITDFVSTSNFDTLTNPVRTLAGNKPGKVELNVISYGGNVNISTGQVNTTINGVVYSDNHLAIYKVGKVLVPSEFFGKKKSVAAPSLAPAPAKEDAKAPKADKVKPPSSNDSSGTTTQVVPIETSGGMRIDMCGMLVALVGIVYVEVLAT
ncbi:fasciclin-like arabinogalactan protein 11 [Cicer arietinum]|uniref:Fasciclin-like arabinogalactan protein 12 n=1 Tax=Cicer arietinum TaxID=3827 RepID=A0A1S2XCA1_CICAR|nr:fasciclin-like arabinogalactan protein 12 [Cicer arietinum]